MQDNFLLEEKLPRSIHESVVGLHAHGSTDATLMQCVVTGVNALGLVVQGVLISISTYSFEPQCNDFALHST